MGIQDFVESIFGGDEEQEDNFEGSFEQDDSLEEAFEQEAVLPDTAETTYRRDDDKRDLVKGAMGGLENLATKIPGYRGYKEKELRREADKLLRQEVAAKLNDQRKRLSELQMQLVHQNQILYLDDLDRAGSKLQLLIDRVTTASYGYAGLFDAVKIKEEQLDALYAFDKEMLDSVDDIAAEVDHVSSAISAQEGVGEAIVDLVGTVEGANRAFGHREETILQAPAWE